MPSAKASSDGETEAPEEARLLEATNEPLVRGSGTVKPTLVSSPVADHRAARQRSLFIFFFLSPLYTQPRALTPAAQIKSRMFH